MVRRHFGVFASTGSGKSNFIAQLIRIISNQYLSRADKNIRIVIFNVQGEYIALTSDILYDSGLIVISEEETFDDLEDYFDDPSDEDTIDECSEIMSLQIKRPGIFENNNEPFIHVFKKILEDQRIIKLSSGIFADPQTIEELVEILNPGTGAGQWQNRIYTTFRRKIVERTLSGYLTDDKIEELE